MNVGIVTTLRAAGKSLASFVRFHERIGVARMYLVFDDPEDPDQALVEGSPRVRVIRSTPAWRQAWRALPEWDKFGDYVDQEVMARQCLNVAAVNRIAINDGVEWLIHIDADELFYLGDETLAAHFSALEEAGVEAIRYHNWESVLVADDVDDPFCELAYFKVNGQELDDAQRAALKPILASRPTPEWFVAYANGKCAAKVGPDLRVIGVHLLSGRENEFHIADGGPVILHFPMAGFAAFKRKFEVLGAFADQAFGTSPYPPLWLAARDLLQHGDLAGLRELFRGAMVWPEELLTSLPPGTVQFLPNVRPLAAP